MPGLAQQRIKIRELEHATAIRRVRLIEACRTFDPPVDAAMVAAGTALIAVELAPGIGAVAALFSRDRAPGDRSRQILKVILETPLLLRSLRRILGQH
ncbi:MAG: hypothetical protein R6V45_04790 [Oceanipulchritudo sp.]